MYNRIIIECNAIQQALLKSGDFSYALTLSFNCLIVAIFRGFYLTLVIVLVTSVLAMFVYCYRNLLTKNEHKLQ
jgi:hypothetical protein